MERELVFIQRNVCPTALLIMAIAIHSTDARYSVVQLGIADQKRFARELGFIGKSLVRKRQLLSSFWNHVGKALIVRKQEARQFARQQIWKRLKYVQCRPK